MYNTDERDGEMAEIIKVKMLGKFSITYGDKQICHESSRSAKLWSILAYLIYNRARVVSQDELLSLLRTEEKGNANPQSTLKTTVFRIRSILNSLEKDLGLQLLTSSNGGYTINPDITIECDYEEFEKLLKSKKADNTLKALELYNGDFLNSFSSEPFVIPISTYYHNMFATALQTVIPTLEKEESFEKGVSLCRFAIKIDPYAEVFYQHLMRCLLSLGKRDDVVTVYEDMSKILLSTFGVMPDAESRALYREALRTVNLHTLSPDNLYDELAEIGPVSGALICDFDFFKMLYQANARMLARSGNTVHIALLSIVSRTKTKLQRRSLDLAMDNLQALLSASLRKGDTITRCSSSQFLIMLPQANYENSSAVCSRIIDGFSRKYPHSPARIDFFVKPILPSTDN